ncbi:MAG: ATP-binding protein [bacterium]
MMESDFTALAHDDTRTSTQSIETSNLISEIFYNVREALVDTSSGNLCAATLERDANQIHISARQPISLTDLQSIQEELVDHLGQLQPAVHLTRNFRTLLNGKLQTGDTLHAANTRFNQHLTLPLAIQKKPVGILFVGSFDKSIDLRQTRLIQHFSNDAPRALRHLLYINSRQKEKFEKLVTRIIDGVILCDWRKKILFINNAAKRLLGVEVSQKLVGKSLKFLPYSFLSDYLDETLKEGIFESNKVACTRENHSQFLGVHIELLKNFRNREMGWMLVLRDVTKNWQSDQMRSSLSIASHEINAPLTSMQGAIDLLLDGDLGVLNQEQEHCLNVVKDDIRRLRAMLKDLLDVTRFDEGIQFLDRRKEVKLGLLVNKVMESFASFAKAKNIRIESAIPKSIPTFKGERDRLQQVLANLIENSIKYTLPGGVVNIQAELEKRTLKVWVQDTGVGIPAEDFERIFERFEQLDNYPEQRQRSYGLGLSIAKQIVKSFGGEMWVESEVGRGSKFYFTIAL